MPTGHAKKAQVSLSLKNQKKNISLEMASAKGWRFNPFIPSGFFSLDSLDQSVSSLMGVWSVFIITMFY